MDGAKKELFETANEPAIRIMKDDEDAIVPTRGSRYAAGLDLYSIEDKVVPVGQQRIVSTGIRMALPPGTYGRIAPKSGLAANWSIHINAGVVDEDYRGVVKVLIHNLGRNVVNINKGEQIAQLIVEKIMKPDIKHVRSLDVTDRGEGGFGSTTTRKDVAPDKSGHTDPDKDVARCRHDVPNKTCQAPMPGPKRCRNV